MWVFDRSASKITYISQKKTGQKLPKKNQKASNLMCQFYVFAICTLSAGISLKLSINVELMMQYCLNFKFLKVKILKIYEVFNYIYSI